MEPAVPASRLLPSAARDFLNHLDSSRSTRVVAAVTGARGSGKSALLDAVRQRFERRGLAPVTAPPPWQEQPRAVVIDDAHLLDERQLAALRDLVADGATNVVASFPSFRRTAALRELAAALERHRPPVALGPLTGAEILGVVGSSGGARLVASLEELSAGQPWLVRRLITALGGRTSPGDLESAEQEVLQRLTVEMGALDPELRDLLVAFSVGFDGMGWLPPGLETGTRVDQQIADARDAGLLTARGTIVPLVARAVLRAVPSYRIRALHEALVDELERSGDLDAPSALVLAASRLHDPRVEKVLVNSADSLLRADPVRAAELYDAAVAAGSPSLPLAARRAQAALGAGHLDVASRFVDEHLAAQGESAAIADIAAALWAHRGSLDRAAECYRVLGRRGDTDSAKLAGIARLAIGDPAGAAEAAASAGTADPVSLAGSTMVGTAISLMERGLRASLDGAGAASLGQLVRAADAMTGAGAVVPLPESPAALCAIVAISVGDLDTAAGVLDSAIEGDHAGPGMRNRLRLLRAWVWMLADRVELATDLAIEVAADGGLSARDQLLLAGLRVGAARRSDDLPRLVDEWQVARGVLLHVPVDLFGLQPLGELAIAAARLRDRPRTAAALAEAWQLLDRLGNPAVWSAPLHFAEVQAAILADSPSDLARHGSALKAIADTTPLAAACASASLSWASVLTGGVDPRTVIASAKALAGVGRMWDGSRLAGHAAAHVEDRKEMARLLAAARELHPGVGQGLPVTGPVAVIRTGPIRTVTAPTRIPSRESSQLSAREREVAAHFLEGRSYREIGEAMFISPRTVEHHMARIRSRFEANSRSELLAVLRRALDDGSAAGGAARA